MTTILPITPHTPSSLLAALALSPVLAPLNSSLTAPSQTSIPSISLLPPSPLPPLNPLNQTPSRLMSPPRQACSFHPIHRVLGLNEARQITLLMIQHLYPVRASHKGIMKASVKLAESLHDSGIRWDQHRRVMGMHLRGIWEEGSRLVGGIDKIANLDAEGQSVVDLYVQGSFLSIAEEPHPLDPTPLPILTHESPLPVLPAQQEEAQMFELDIPPPSPWYASDKGEEDEETESIRLPASPAKDHTVWRKRLNHAMMIHIDRKQMMATHSVPPLSAISAMSMMSVTELKWTLARRMKYRLGRAIWRTPRSVKKLHFGGWEMR